MNQKQKLPLDRLEQLIFYSLNPSPDVVIFTGDAVDEGNLKSHQHYGFGMDRPVIPAFQLM
jgi:hypothetical protein